MASKQAVDESITQESLALKQATMRLPERGAMQGLWGRWFSGHRREGDAMPHCILEYSANVPDRPDVARVLADVHGALMATGLFTLADIKSRAVRHEQFLIGDGDPARVFVTLTVQILDGRSDAVKAQISEAALEVLARHFPESLARRTCSLTVQVCDIHRASYRRRLSSAD